MNQNYTSMKKNIFLLLLFVVVANSGSAQQYRTTLKLSSARIIVPGKYNGFDVGNESGIPMDQRGLYAERVVFKNWGMGIGFSWWNNSRVTMPMDNSKYEGSITTDAAVIPGRVDYGPDYRREVFSHQKSYKMVDWYGYYRYGIGKRHAVKAGLGMSCAWGDDYYGALKPGWNSFELVDVMVKTTPHWGVLPMFSYDFNFLRDRLNVGVDLRGRKYSGLNDVRYDAGLHVGVNL